MKINKKWLNKGIILILAVGHILALMPKLLQTGWAKWSFIGSDLYNQKENTFPYAQFDMEDHWAISGLESLTWQWSGGLKLVKKNESEQWMVSNISIEDIKNSGTLYLSLTGSFDVGLGYLYGQAKITDFSTATIQPHFSLMARW